jgi:hypothetical protein
MIPRYPFYGCVRLSAFLLGLIALAPLAGRAQDVKVSVQDDQGQPIASGFRWLLEEDNSYVTTPGVATPNAAMGAVPGDPSYTLAVNVHHSHAPVVCAGDTQPANAADPPPAAPVPGPSFVVIDASNCPGFSSTKRYLVSVLPWHTTPAGASPNAQRGATMSGRPIAPGQRNSTVVVHGHPVPTGQITVVVFWDNQPTNAAYDQPAETGLPGFDLIVTDPVGKVLQDAFGNPLGTTYKYKHTTADGRPADAAGNPLRQEEQPEYQADAKGLPVVDFLGDGSLRTCPGPAVPVESYNPYQKANCIDPYTLVPMQVGEAVVRYLDGNKFAIEPVPPGSDPDWILTGTLEGTRGNDAWVRAGEPRYNIVLGQQNWLVFYGFVKPMNNLAQVANPDNLSLGNITGQVVTVHDMHPPLQPGLVPGVPVTNAYVSVNNLNGNDEQVYTAPCDPNTGQFTITGLVPGTYELAFFNEPVDTIIDYRVVRVTEGQTLDLKQIPVFRWFGQYSGTVFQDNNQNGFRDSGEKGIANIPVNLHYSDGSVYASTNTDQNGNFNFPEFFSWWRFLIADIDFARFMPTGMTAWVDNGGSLPRDRSGQLTTMGANGLNPQVQPDGKDHRTETGTVISEAIQTFQDMNNRIDWGKAPWPQGQNGGVQGIINYAVTRTEEDPSTSTIDPWEPGIPRVKVLLHKAKQDMVHGSALGNYWVISDADDPRFPLATNSDSWDDNQPTNCVGARGVAPEGPLLWPQPELVNGFGIPSCAETFYHWDQIRPAVMDGTYWFKTMDDGSPIPPGNYVVQVVAPPGYRAIQWGDRNIEFGDPKVPFLVYYPPCVGAPYTVPPYHTLYPDQQVPTDFPGGVNGAGVWTNPQAPSCDLKYVPLNPGGNAVVNFHLLTMVPKAARIWGTVWNDLSLEFNPASPNSSGNFGVPWIPVAIKDWQGTEVARFYTDQWGHFNGLVPANYDIAPPIPLGLTLALYTIAPNDPGPVLDTDPSSPTYNQFITDKWFNPEYSQEVIRENWEFYSGRTTFIDTIVLPVGAFVDNRIPLNCDYTDHTPELKQVSDVIIPQTPGGYTITITSIGIANVPNPDYDPNNVNSPATLTWDHGFGPGGTVTVGGTPLAVSAWASDGGSITAKVPPGVFGQLIVTRSDNHLATTVGVTLHAASASQPVVAVAPPPAGCTGLACRVIQPAIDSAPNGAILVLAPGAYQENVILWKPLTLQGKGAAVTVFDGTAALGNFQLKEAQFNEQQALIANSAIGVVPGQTSDFTLEQGAGILVAGCQPGSCPQNNDFSSVQSRIDGITVTGATEAGGGVLVNGFVANLQITNNEVFSNQGSIGGGIRSGESALIGPLNPTGGNFNPNMVIDHNRISQNGSLFSGGGGIALYTGTDNYAITNNFICGNFSANYGGGIGHLGLSQNGVIVGNKIVSNESFDEGGGIHVGGENLNGAVALTPGAGSVLIRRNLILGNKGGGDGGGIRSRKFNGQDVDANPADTSKWYVLDILDNIIANNSSAHIGGGMAFDDTVIAHVIGNTVADNDSTSTSSDSFGNCVEGQPVGQTCPAPEAFVGGITNTQPSVGGIAAQAHSSALLNVLGQSGSFCESNPTDPLCMPWSNPTMIDDIVWKNRSFYWDAAANSGLGALLQDPNRRTWDFGVYDTGNADLLTATFCMVTDNVGLHPSSTNLVGVDPQFVSPYLNIYQATSKGAALGNFVVATFHPNGIRGDYHILGSSRAVRAGSIIPPGTDADYDGHARRSPVDIGAHQVNH